MPPLIVGELVIYAQPAPTGREKLISAFKLETARRSGLQSDPDATSRVPRAGPTRRRASTAGGSCGRRCRSTPEKGVIFLVPVGNPAPDLYGRCVRSISRRALDVRRPVGRCASRSHSAASVTAQDATRGLAGQRQGMRGLLRMLASRDRCSTRCGDREPARMPDAWRAGPSGGLEHAHLPDLGAGTAPATSPAGQCRPARDDALFGVERQRRPHAARRARAPARWSSSRTHALGVDRLKRPDLLAVPS